MSNLSEKMSEFINFKSKIVEQKAKAKLKKSGLLCRVGNRFTRF